MKYTDTMVTFSEVPDKISLCINISGCPNRCPGCHSPELWEDIGTELNEDSLTKLINKNEGITCVCFMGGDADPEYVLKLAKFIKEKFPIKTCWYSGQDYEKIQHYRPYKSLDYLKVGPYKEECGGLDNPNTNQHLLKIEYAGTTCNGYQENWKFYDITSKFWKNEQSNS